MNKCFRCQQETAKPNEVYYRIKKIGEDSFNTYCCESCWDNHKKQILKEDKNIISVSGEQDNLHQIVYTQATCSQCNQYKKVLCQCNQRKPREEQHENDCYKCLKCGKKGDMELNQTDCPACHSRNLEFKINSPVGHAFGSFHFTTRECPQCHLYKDIEFHDLSGSRVQATKSLWIAEWTRNGEYCTNSSHKLGDNDRERERERETKTAPIPLSLTQLSNISRIII